MYGNHNKEFVNLMAATIYVYTVHILIFYLLLQYIL